MKIGKLDYDFAIILITWCLIAMTGKITLLTALALGMVAVRKR